MTRIGDIIPVVIGASMLIWFSLRRHRFPPGRRFKLLANGISLFLLGLVIGPLPWAFGIQSESVRIAASWFSMLASVISVALIIQWRRAWGRPSND